MFVMSSWSSWSIVRRLGVIGALTILALAVIVALFWPVADMIAAHDVGRVTGLYGRCASRRHGMQRVGGC